MGNLGVPLPVSLPVRLAQPVLGGLRRLLCAYGRIRPDKGHPNPVMNETKYETHEHDVLIIGAGGAGLRAAIEAMGQGAKVAVVSKSLLAKPHTVLAQRRIPPPMP